MSSAPNARPGPAPKRAAVVSRYVVLADWLFTATTVVIQPLTGFYLMHLAGIALHTRWIAWSIVLYLVAGACWLPVLWLQLRMRDMAALAVREAGATARAILAFPAHMGAARHTRLPRAGGGVLPDGRQARVAPD